MNRIHAALLCSLLPFLSPAQDESPREINAGDFPSLQEAINALPVTGGIVHLPPGNFAISEPLRISTAETRLLGSGPSTHIQNQNEEGLPALLLQSPEIGKDPKAKLWRVELANFRISGSEQSGEGILAVGIQEIFLHGLSVDHNGGHGISLINCYEDPRVADSILTYNKKSGLHIDAGHDIVVNANHFEENWDAVTCVDSFNLCMNGNNLDDHLGNGVVIENTYGSVLSGNMIEECNGTAIILDRDCYGITLSANVIAHDMKGGVDLRDAHGCAVSGNTFTLMHGFGVRVGPESSRIAISANAFSNSYIGKGEIKRPVDHEKAIQRDAGSGIVLEQTSHHTISGNTFSGLEGSAVSADAKTHHLVITGNMVTDIGRRTEGEGKAFDLPENDSILLQNNLAD
ncbi:MAG: right-handed parallel beta-helix repeat-containing protein [Verrucomicrobiales bacterium]|nr:right-handed parallel beta-helix repeat-containing protein [Verrucomicrobiales bacterium]